MKLIKKLQKNKITIKDQEYEIINNIIINFKNDFEIINELIKIEGYFIYIKLNEFSEEQKDKLLNDSFQSDYKILNLINEKDLKYLLNNKNSIIHYYIKYNKEIKYKNEFLEFVKKNYFNDEEILINLIKNNIECLDFCSDELKFNENFILKYLNTIDINYKFNLGLIPLKMQHNFNIYSKLLILNQFHHNVNKELCKFFFKLKFLKN